MQHQKTPKSGLSTSENVCQFLNRSKGRQQDSLVHLIANEHLVDGRNPEVGFSGIAFNFPVASTL